MLFALNQKPQKGDIIRTHRKYPYWHFGIYCDDEHVIHFSGNGEDSVNNAENVKIIETSLSFFLRGDPLEVNVEFDSPFERDEIVKRARSFLGQSRFNGKYYNFFTNNCEHFAMFCYTGNAISQQVKDNVNGTKKAARLLGEIYSDVMAVKTLKKMNKDLNDKNK